MSVLLGFDFGLKRIGISIGDSITRTARPLRTIANDWPQIDALLREWTPMACVIGLPLDAQGQEQDITRSARKFSRRLAQHSGLPVHLVDERMSSLAAQSMMRADRDRGVRLSRLQDRDIDSHAACIVLQQWIDEHLST